MGMGSVFVVGWFGAKIKMNPVLQKRYIPLCDEILGAVTELHSAGGLGHLKSRRIMG